VTIGWDGTISRPARRRRKRTRRLAEFVGRLYLLLVTVVYDHPRWLRKDLRRYYRSALLAVYPAVRNLQAALNDPQVDPRGGEEVMRLLRDAGLSGSQLDLKLAAFRGAEARFYGGRIDSETRPKPDRRFGDEASRFGSFRSVKAKSCLSRN
jgi:hypothetical protein